MKPRPKLTIVDLFAGCGGLSLGFENVGYIPVFVNEINQDAMSTYLRNRHHKLGGLLFKENKDLHCYDSNDLDIKRILKLKSDLSNIPEINFYVDKTKKEIQSVIEPIVISWGYDPENNSKTQFIDFYRKPNIFNPDLHILMSHLHL